MSSKNRPSYLTASEVAATLKITLSGAYKIMWKMAARKEAQVVKLGRVALINEADFWKAVENSQV